MAVERGQSGHLVTLVCPPSLGQPLRKRPFLTRSWGGPVNAGPEGFVRTAASELPRGLRVTQTAGAGDAGGASWSASQVGTPPSSRNRRPASARSRVASGSGSASARAARAGAVPTR